MRLSRAREQARAAAQHQGDRAEHLGAVAERSGQDRDVVGRGADGAAAQGGGERVEQQVARGGEVAADDDPLRVEQVAERRDGAADGGAGVADRPRAARVAVAGGGDHGGQGGILERAAQRGEDRLGAGEGLEAAAVAAAADRAVRGDDRVADLARRAARAAVGAAAHDQARPDAGRELEVGEVPGAAAGAPHPLAERAEARVVLHLDRVAERLGHRVGRAHADPAGEDRRVAELARRAVDRARQAHADPGDLGAARAGLVEHLADEPRRERDRLRRRQVGAERLVALREHAVGEVGERDPQVALAEVEPERHARRAVERHEHGRAADPAARHARRPSTTSRSSCSSVMTAETVEGARAVRRASSAREVGPARGEHAEHASACGEPGRIHAGSIMPGFASDVRTRALEFGLDGVEYFEIAQTSGSERSGGCMMGRFRVRAGSGMALLAAVAVVAVPAAGGAHRAKQPEVGKPRMQDGCARIESKLPTYADWPRVHSRIKSDKKLEARVQLDALQAHAGGEGRADDPARDHDDHPGPGGGVPHRLRAQRRRRLARREQARLAGRLAGARRRLLGRLQAGQHGRRARDLGHRRRPRQLQHLRRDPVPAQHRARRRARPVPDPRRPGRHGAPGARDRPGLGVRADAGRRPRRPLGPHVRGLLRGPADHARLRLRGDPRPAGPQPPRHRLRRRDRHRQALHRRRRHRGRQGPGRQRLLRGRR